MPLSERCRQMKSASESPLQSQDADEEGRHDRFPMPPMAASSSREKCVSRPRSFHEDGNNDGRRARIPPVIMGSPRDASAAKMIGLLLNGRLPFELLWPRSPPREVQYWRLRVAACSGRCNCIIAYLAAAMRLNGASLLWPPAPQSALRRGVERYSPLRRDIQRRRLL